MKVYIIDHDLRGFGIGGLNCKVFYNYDEAKKKLDELFPNSEEFGLDTKTEWGNEDNLITLLEREIEFPIEKEFQKLKDRLNKLEDKIDIIVNAYCINNHVDGPYSAIDHEGEQD